eukprot:TRINITY_DN26701_c0_g1_i1.p1 TRINITY_DN26701_c0_g1~~TRINITY_DN26701_c0_g1_i1.p1  ORF type:complete len:1031 (-),score=142.28 TRINITY_DN26701_c0_g1_i1:189-3281(-)
MNTVLSSSESSSRQAGSESEDDDAQVGCFDTVLSNITQTDVVGIVVQETPEEHEANGKLPWSEWLLRTRRGWFSMCCCTLTIVSVFIFVYMYCSVRSPPATPSELGYPHNFPACDLNEAKTWQPFEKSDPAVVVAMNRGLHLVDVHRLRCNPKVPMLAGSSCTSWAEDFYAIVPETVSPHWRHKKDCSGFDVKLEWSCGQDKQEMSVSFTPKTSTWELLATVPDHCVMSADTEGSWVEINITEDVVKVGVEATGRLQRMMEMEGCAGQTPIALKQVWGAASKAVALYSIGMILLVDVPGNGTVIACMTAEQDPDFDKGKSLNIGTGFFGDSKFRACGSPLEEWGACYRSGTVKLGRHQKPLEGILNSVSTARRLQDQGLGLQVEDPHVEASERQLMLDDWLSGRQPAAGDHVKPPLQHRKLSKKQKPGVEIPEDHAPHLRGEYLHCYKDSPILDQGGCGLCYAAASVTMMSLRKCITMTEAGEQAKPEAYHYATQEFGECACGKGIEPGDGMFDIAKNCVARSGCSGGNILGVWDRWMRMHKGKLRSRYCYPYTHKCKSSSGIVNPYMGGGQCAEHRSQSLWDRPCHCIDPSLQNQPWGSCPTSQDDCSTLDIPDRMYFVSVRPQGLSAQETVENIQLHLIEGGPLYATVIIPQSFWSFFGGSQGRAGDVYSDPSTESTGGHAIVLVGWGKTTARQPKGVGPGQTYWTLRNSWGPTWSENGYGNVLAGKDIMNIESRVVAAMFGDHDDFASPSCKWTTYTEMPISLPIGLARYTMGLSIVCSEEATLEVLVEQAKTDGGTRRFYQSKPFRCGSSMEGHVCNLNNIDLLGPGYGVSDAIKTVSIIIRSWDEDGNEAWLPYGITMHGTGSSGISDVGVALFGVPAASCMGCKDHPYSDPGAALEQLRKINQGEKAADSSVDTLLERAAPCSFIGSSDLGSLLQCNFIAYVGSFCALLFCMPLCCCFCCNCIRRKCCRQKQRAYLSIGPPGDPRYVDPQGGGRPLIRQAPGPQPRPGGPRGRPALVGPQGPRR